MRQPAAFLLICLLAVSASAGASTRLSSAPFIYVINYSDKWITNPSALDEFGDMPPDMLHIGKAVPITHNWGAIPYMSGENQDTGGPGHTLNRDNVRLLSQAELQQKIDTITASVKRLHDAGVGEILPYICFFSVAGDHESREGLWAFYDRWDDYAKWLGPKPKTGPTAWLTRDAKGKRIETSYGFTPPYYEPLHRYGCCPNNPDWNQFIVSVVKLVAQCGYDGVFVDNSGRGGDQCEYCEASFAKWVGENFDRATLARACGTDEIGEINLSNPSLSIARNRWNVALARDRLARLREVGAAIKPGFKVFPNVGRYQRALPYGDGCDYFMFESVKHPGYLAEGEPLDDPEALIEVAEGAELVTASIRYDQTHGDVFSEASADVRYPRSCPAGQPAELVVSVLTVGASNRDADALDSLALRLTHIESGAQTVVPMGPLPGVGDPAQVPGAERPPVDLKGTWTPARTGAYTIDLMYNYTDAEHRDVADHVAIVDRLGVASQYRTNLADLACSFNSGCRTISLDYEHVKKGRERIQELAIAEGAAAGGRHTVNTRGEPQRKYWRFFHDHGEVSAGLKPYGDVKILYAYWGGNPGSVGRNEDRTIHGYLSANHVLFTGLVDRDLEPADLAGAGTLVMVCRNYDLTAEQIAAIRDFVALGGRLILGHEDVTINFAPMADVMPGAFKTARKWSWEQPPRLGPALCPAKGRLRGVRFAAFIEPSAEPRRLVLHALNYNVSLVETSIGTLTPVAGCTVDLPVPEDWGTVTATVYDPDAEEPLTIDCRVADGVARMTLPELAIYQVIELVAG